MNLDRKDITLRFTVAVLLVTGSFLFFQFVIPYHLFLKEQLQLFLLTSDYFLSYFDKPAWLSRCLGDFLTQFFYLRGGGAIVAAVLLLIEWGVVLMVLRKFDGDRMAPLWALFPVCIDWMLYGDIYFALGFSIAFIITLLVFRLYVMIRNPWVSVVTAVLLLPLLYSLCGGYMFLFPFLLFFYGFCSKGQRWLLAVPVLAVAVIYPLLVRHYFLLTTSQAYLYPVTHIRFLLPALMLLLVILAIRIRAVRDARMTVGSFVVNVCVILSLLGGGLFYTTNLNREKILGMSSEAYFGNWEKVSEIAGKYKLPNTHATYYANMALSQRGQLPEQLMHYYQPASQGLFLPVIPEADWLTIFFSSDAFFYVGDMNMAQHSAMLGMLFSPSLRSSRMVMRLAEINLVNNDSTATRKYLRMLDATLFHKKKAGRIEGMLEADSIGDYTWLQEKRACLPLRDTLHRADDYPASLQLLVESNPENKPALDYLLCYYLLHKDIPSFFVAFNKYHTHKKKEEQIPVPRVYAEALLIYLAATKASQKAIDGYGISPEIMEEFVEYNRLYEESEGNLQPIQERFATSYWMYYHFARIME